MPRAARIRPPEAGPLGLFGETPKTLKCSATLGAMNDCQRMRRLTAGCAMAITLGIVTAPLAGAETIDQMVQDNPGSLESPLWRQLHENGYGYLDVQRVNNDSKIVCANRKAGVPPYQIEPLLQSRGYTATEAQAIVLAEMTASESTFAVC